MRFSRYCSISLLCTLAFSIIANAKDAERIKMPENIEELSRTYSLCLSTYYDDSQQRKKAHANSKRKAIDACRTERNEILLAFPAKDRSAVESRINTITNDGFELRKRHKAKKGKAKKQSRGG